MAYPQIEVIAQLNFALSRPTSPNGGFRLVTQAGAVTVVLIGNLIIKYLPLWKMHKLPCKPRLLRVLAILQIISILKLSWFLFAPPPALKTG